jgi:hypothetical protein
MMISVSIRAAAAIAIAAAVSPACGPGNIRTIRVDSDTVREIRIITRGGSMPADVLAVIDREGRFILPPLKDVLAAITEVLPSPVGDLALVVSVGEGHPWIAIYRLADWVRPNAPNGEEIKPLASMDPYPYAWTDITWIDGRNIRFRSPGDYSRFDVRTRRPDAALLTDEIAGLWIWNIESDIVKKSAEQAF